MQKLITLSVALIIGSWASAQNILAEAELRAENVNRIKVEGKFVDVDVKKGDDVYFKGIITGNGDEGDYEFKTRIIGNTLDIQVSYTKNNYSWKSYKIRESSIQLTIPQGVSLEIDNSSGDISISYLDAEEKSEIEASSGDVTIVNAQSDIQIETSSGDIGLKNVTGELEVSSSSGDQEFTLVNGHLEIIATSGDVEVEQVTGSLDIETSSGEVDIRDCKVSMRVETTSGDVDAYALTLVGDAYFRTSSGDLEVEFTNDIDKMSFDLTASSGDIDVGSLSGDKRLMIDNGGYKVTGISSSGDQDYSN